jgi:hypothetical protein
MAFFLASNFYLNRRMSSRAIGSAWLLRSTFAWKYQNSEKDLPWRSFARYVENNDPSDEE